MKFLPIAVLAIGLLSHSVSGQGFGNFFNNVASDGANLAETVARPITDFLGGGGTGEPAAEATSETEAPAETPAEEPAAENAGEPTEGGEAPADETPAAEETPAPEGEATEAPAAEETPAAETPAEEAPAAEGEATEAAAEPEATEVPAAEGEAPADETRAGEPEGEATEAPAGEGETPAAEAEVTETPAEETPAAEGEATEGGETPAAEETPATEGEATETPAEESKEAETVNEPESTEAPSTEGEVTEAAAAEEAATEATEAPATEGESSETPAEEATEAATEGETPAEEASAEPEGKSDEAAAETPAGEETPAEAATEAAAEAEAEATEAPVAEESSEAAAEEATEAATEAAGEPAAEEVTEAAAAEESTEAAGEAAGEEAATEAATEGSGEGEQVEHHELSPEAAANEPTPGTTSGILRSYDDLDFNSESHDYSVLLPPQCQKIEHPAKSVVTYGTCVDLFPTEDCSGEDQVRISQEAGFFFSDVTRLPSVGVTGSIQTPALAFRACPVENQEEQTEVAFYKDRNYIGHAKKIDVPSVGCVNLGDLRDEVSSIDTHGTCIQMFLFDDCAGPSIRVFPGTSFPHTNLNKVLFEDSTKPLEDNAESVRRCSIVHEDFKNAIPEPVNGIINVFSEANLKGPQEEIDLSDGNCHALGVKPKSMKSNNNCVILYQESTCIGSTRRVFPGAEFEMMETLSGVDFIPSGDDVAANTMAVRRCKLP